MCQVLNLKFLGNQEISDYTDYKMITLIRNTSENNEALIDQRVGSSFSEFSMEGMISNLGGKRENDQ
jgi:hypothetical protein